MERTNSGYGSSESWGLVMVGGISYNDLGPLSSVETTNNGEDFGSLPDLEIENGDSCLVVIDEDKIFTCGGLGASTDTFVFSKTTNLWSRYTQWRRIPFQKYLIIVFQHD